MAKGTKDVPELVRAAQAFENELVDLEELSRSVRKIRLDSDKNIARAAKELNEALAVPDRLASGLRGLASAMSAMQLRQQAALDPLAVHAAEIQRRMQQLGEYMQAYAALGKQAGEVTAVLQVEHEERGAIFDAVESELMKITEGARSLCQSAREDDFPEVAREADALRQRISALRGRLKGN
jgi:chromosome segregation ATPase